MTYEESLQYIESVQKFGSKLGLKNITTLLNKLGNPQEQLKIIHVAGTNGKGSVCAMITSILEQGGYQVGLYTSPHLMAYNERIQINGRSISNQDFGDLVGIIKEKCNEMVEEKMNHPTFFECLTAMALYYFAQQKIDYVILEVGLGGRYDATNAITSPFLSIITSISLDHTELLGNTLEKIAWEKGGIIKENCPVVLYSADEQVYNIINNISMERNARLYYNTELIFEHVKYGTTGQVFSIKTCYYHYEKLFLNLLGAHQLYNAAVVLLAITAMKEMGTHITEEEIRAGLEKVRWPGRMELVSKEPMILLDGAHNPAGVKSLRNVFVSLFRDKEITLVFGVLEDKAYHEMINTLTPYVKQIILTEPNNKRALAVEQLRKEITDETIPVYLEKDMDQAIILGKQLAGKNGLLCFAGSLYLIGDIRKKLIEGGI